MKVIRPVKHKWSTIDCNKNNSRCSYVYIPFITKHLCFWGSSTSLSKKVFSIDILIWHPIFLAISEDIKLSIFQALFLQMPIKTLFNNLSYTNFFKVSIFEIFQFWFTDNAFNIGKMHQKRKATNVKMVSLILTIVSK